MRACPWGNPEDRECSAPAPGKKGIPWGHEGCSGSREPRRPGLGEGSSGEAQSHCGEVPGPCVRFPVPLVQGCCAALV